MTNDSLRYRILRDSPRLSFTYPPIRYLLWILRWYHVFLNWRFFPRDSWRLMASLLCLLRHILRRNSLPYRSLVRIMLSIWWGLVRLLRFVSWCSQFLLTAKRCHRLMMWSIDLLLIFLNFDLQSSNPLPGSFLSWWWWKFLGWRLRLSLRGRFVPFFIEVKGWCILVSVFFGWWGLSISAKGHEICLLRPYWRLMDCFLDAGVHQIVISRIYLKHFCLMKVRIDLNFLASNICSALFFWLFN